MRYNRYKLCLSAIACALCTTGLQAAKPKGKDYRPRLVVQIVVSQMRYDYLERFSANLSETGFRRFMHDGTVFTEARYGYMMTGTEAGLATITTGAMPATHGIVAGRWVDLVSGQPIELAHDKSVGGLDCDAGIGCNSPHNLTVPTLGDRLAEQSPESKVVTLAASASSAVVMGGSAGQVYWCDQSRGTWISSTHYMPRLPEWIVKYNDTRSANQYLGITWQLSKPVDKYVNKRYTILEMTTVDPSRRQSGWLSEVFKKQSVRKDYPNIYHTWAGNALVAEFARSAVIHCDLGRDENPDLLNICFDSPRVAAGMFGPESMEVEDMIYRLDDEISALLSFLFAQLGEDNVVVVLTSDHGCSDSFDRLQSAPRDRFNALQFRVIMNGFMSAQFGEGDWVTDYADRQLYLNRSLIYRKGLSLEDVQNRAAAFALSFRGVSHAMTATALNNSSFSSGIGMMMQNSFYPRRSGDVILNLMPGWIEESEGMRCASGSLYDYDTHVPVMVLGGNIGARRVSMPVDVTSIAPTLARLMRINRPEAATGTVLAEITE